MTITKANQRKRIFRSIWLEDEIQVRVLAILSVWQKDGPKHNRSEDPTYDVIHIAVRLLPQYQDDAKLWIGNPELQLCHRGLKEADGTLTPIPDRYTPTPETILQVIQCNCKSRLQRRSVHLQRKMELTLLFFKGMTKSESKN